ncbi:MAG: alpha-1,2-fucosyltransferase [Bacilli bacterium]|nr:alpha-1,2-fucosyltransferase [Bacilli bacterium]
MNKKIKSIILYTFGLLFFGFTSLVFMISITRINGVEDAGKFAFAYAVACTFYAIGTYIGKAYQVTDLSKDNKDKDYIINKIISCGIMIIMTIIFSLCNHYSFDKLLLIIVLTIFRCADAFVEVYHAIIQKKDDIAKIGISMFIRTIILMLSFVVSLYVKHDLLFSSFVIMFINLFYIFIIDYLLVKKNIDKSKPTLYSGIYLLIAGLPICLFSFISVYVFNSSKYAIDAFSTNSVQGIFNIIFMPASFLSLIGLYLTQSFLKDFTLFIEKKDYSNLTKLLFKISRIMIAFGLITIAIAYFIGIDVLQFIYNQSLNNMRMNLMIILFGSIIYSICLLLSNVFVSLKKNLLQLFLLFINFIITLIVSPIMVKNFGISGACYAYLIVVLLQLLLFIIGYIWCVRTVTTEKNITVRLMGGLGNQMFQYAFLRNLSLNNNAKGIIDLQGITNKTHNKYGLDHCNISKDIKFINKDRSIRQYITYFMYGFYCVFLESKKYGFNLYNILLSLTNSHGVLCIPDGYMDIKELKSDKNYSVGYFQSPQYSKEFVDIIRDELQITDKLKGMNKKVYQDISNNESVCVHIRRGDYVGSNFDVCSMDYYYRGIKEIKKHKKSIVIYVFSDDINWVKKNMKFEDEVVFVDWKNNQYEDMKLMSGCKNFVMSNSSFSYWAQYLSQNKKKIVVAPSKWFRNGKKIDIYDDSWILVDVKGE